MSAETVRLTAAEQQALQEVLLDAETAGALPWDPGVTERELVAMARRPAVRPAALVLGCVAAMGHGCRCEGCTVVAAEADLVRAEVVRVLRHLRLSGAALLLVSRGMLDAESVAAIGEAIGALRDVEGTAQKLLARWVDDLSAGRTDRVRRSLRLWDRRDCVACVTACFERGVMLCDGCADEAIGGAP